LTLYTTVGILVVLKWIRCPQTKHAPFVGRYTISLLSILTHLLLWCGLGLLDGIWCLTTLSTIFSYIVAVGFIGGGNRR